MKKKKEDKIIPIEGHRLSTRRDFLGQGLVAGLGYTLAPSVLGSLYSNAAQAVECGSTAQFAQKTPVIILDLAGGANFAGSNVMVGGAGGQLDFIADYTTLGLPASMGPAMTGQLNNEMGLMFHNDSAILRGIQNTTSMANRLKCDGGIFCTSSSDDTSNNPHNPMYWLNKAGAEGELTPLAGTRNTPSGGRSVMPPESFNPALQPVTLTRPSDALSLVNVGKLGSLFDQAKAEKILKSIENLSESRIASFAQQSLPDQVKDLIRCGYVGTNDLISKFTAQAIDPSLDNAVLQAFDNLGDGDQRKTATIAKMVIDGYIGAGTVEKGGYDYHNGTRATGENRDFDAGELIGRIISLAALKGKDVMIYVISDGAVSAKNEVDNSNDGRGKFVWSGDSGQRSSAFMLLYRNAGRATLRTGRRQVGHFKDNGAVENSATPASNSVTNLAKLITANYLALHGEEAKLAEVVGDNPFGASLNDYLLFNKIN
ncbi:MAG: general secretion pathway protein GspF [Halobacteriovoraceae bacterium]|nr:general secretion pathway protein GspF [Halobacteriovoraceae bacterium]